MRLPPRMLDDARALAAGADVAPEASSDHIAAVAAVYGADAVEPEPHWTNMTSILAEESSEQVRKGHRCSVCGVTGPF